MKNIFVALLALIAVASCSKSEQTSDAQQVSAEAALVQKPLKLSNSAGEELTVTYFSEGDLVAVKIQKTGEAEQKLVAKTVNHTGNPIFTNENYMWEITQEGQAGKLSDKSGNITEYIPAAAAD